MTSRARALFLAATLLAACGGGQADEPAGGLEVAAGDVTKADPGKSDTSAEAVFLDFAFSAELRTDSRWRPEAQIEDQLLYTIGHLNEERSVGRLDKLVLSDVVTEDVEGGVRISYGATLLVAWGKRSSVPSEYVFHLPRDLSYTGQQAFTDKYGHDCVDYGAHDVTPGSMWYYFRPSAYQCHLDEADVVTATAAVSVSAVNTTGKYPEYHRVWEDGELRIVAVFGKYEDGATTAGDAGISGYDRFHSGLSSALRSHGLVTEPAEVPDAPGVEVPEVRYQATLEDGRTVDATALMVDNVRTAGADFDRRYGELSGRADLIVYNGHAGLGANIRTLASKGQWVAGQYAIVFMNGCDTYAYVDSALFDAHAEVNPDDPAGTRHLDIVTNAMPSFFSSMSRATMALVGALMAPDDPRTYEQLFRDIDSSQVVLVSGEEDNEFVPGMLGGDGPTPEPDPSWGGLDESGTLALDEEAHLATPVLPAGTYAFSMTGTGDADLYVRVGLEPTTGSYDCRPFRSGSEEACRVELPSEAAIHVLVRGAAASSDYHVVGRPEA